MASVLQVHFTQSEFALQKMCPFAEENRPCANVFSDCLVERPFLVALPCARTSSTCVFCFTVCILKSDALLDIRTWPIFFSEGAHLLQGWPSCCDDAWQTPIFRPRYSRVYEFGDLGHNQWWASPKWWAIVIPIELRQLIRQPVLITVFPPLFWPAYCGSVACELSPL